MRVAIIKDGVVTEVHDIGTSTLADYPDAGFVEAFADTMAGDSYSNGVFTEPADTRTDAELAEDARGQRNIKLAATDFHALTDTDMSEAMTTYRQALRDVPQQDGFPTEITWPTEPV